MPRVQNDGEDSSKESGQDDLHALGGHRLRRHYHYCGSCEKGFYPLDRKLELREKGEVSEAFEKRLIDFSVNEPYAEAAERIALHYGLEVSTNLLRCVRERVGSDAVSVAGVALHEELVPNRPVAQRLSVQTDGCMLPLLDRWKEAKLVVVLREDCHLRGSRSSKGTTTEMR